MRRRVGGGGQGVKQCAGEMKGRWDGGEDRGVATARLKGLPGRSNHGGGSARGAPGRRSVEHRKRSPLLALDERSGGCQFPACISAETSLDSDSNN